MLEVPIPSSSSTLLPYCHLSSITCHCSLIHFHYSPPLDIQITPSKPKFRLISQWWPLFLGFIWSITCIIISCHHLKENYHWSVSHFPNLSSYPSSFSYIWCIHFNSFSNSLGPLLCWPHYPLFHQQPFLFSYPFMFRTYVRVHFYHNYCVKILLALSSLVQSLSAHVY